MRNKIEDLRNHMFEALERLKEAESPEQIKQELERSKAVADIGRVLVDSAKVEVDLVKAAKGQFAASEFMTGVKHLNA